MGAAGPWGRLSRQTLLLEPPMEWFTFDSCQTDLPVWQVPVAAAGSLWPWLSERGVAEEEVSWLVASSRCDGLGLCLVFPDEDVLMALAPVARLLLREDLGRDHGSQGTGLAYHRPKAWDDIWSVYPSTSARSRDLIHHLSYERDRMIYMGDLTLLCRLTASAHERVALQHDIWRRLALAVRLTIPDDNDVAGVIAYWDRGFRAKSVRALIRSTARYGGEHGIDLMHLLPPIPRMLLNTYPDQDQRSRDCHWTALNFFADEPDDRFLDADEVKRAYRQDFFTVGQADMRYGDLNLFFSAEDRLLHASVYLADGIVFTKNGSTTLQPWMLTDIVSMWRLYGEPPEMKVLRHRQLVRH